MTQPTVTTTTCGDACWQAREDTCRCSCGGVNHGIDRREGARPERTRMVMGTRYVLHAVVPRFYDANRLANELVASMPTIQSKHGYYYSDHDYAFAAPATESQLRWAEVEPFTGTRKPYLVWRRTP